MESIQANIEHKISRLKKGSLFFPTDFRGEGSSAAIKMALSRLTAKGKVKRLSHGIYYVPERDRVLGELYPDPEKVAEAVAKKEKVRIRPTGSQALHKLGLTTQVPTKMTYLTDGERRQIKMGNLRIEFKPTTPKKMAFEGQLSSLVILGLIDIGTKNLPVETEKQIKGILQAENHEVLTKDLALAPAHIYDFVIHLLSDRND